MWAREASGAIVGTSDKRAQIRKTCENIETALTHCGSIFGILMRCERFPAALFAIVAGLGAGLAEAQGYPSKPVRFILPYAAGGSYDAIARMVG